MHRFYLPPENCREPILKLTEREAHHAAQVLRVQAGEEAVVLDGAGNEFHCEIAFVSRKNVELQIRQKKFTPSLPHEITLLQAIPKGQIIESIIQKATELGATRIVPILSARVTTHLDDAAAEAKAAKWRLTTIEAIKQCGQPWLPKLDKPTTLKNFLSRGEQFELPLVGSLQSDSKNPRDYFTSFVAEHKRKPRTVCVWVGPEGDFSPEEMVLLKKSGALPITLGRLVLRCETAAIYCLSILNYELNT